MKAKSEFSKNVLTLMTGTAVAQAIPIAISPILTRVYSPEDFGVLGLFVAITTVFASVANGRYELAIMLPRKNSEAINLLALGFVICAIISVILFLVALALNEKIKELLGNESIGLWLYFVPFAVFLSGCFNVLNYYNVRIKNYKDIRDAAIAKSFVTASVQLVFGFLKSGSAGLIGGQILSQLASNTRLIKNIGKGGFSKPFCKIKMIALAKRYRDFPKFTLWAGLANTLSQNINNVLISSYYGLSTLGYYSFTERMLGMPASLIGNAVGQVFFQEASKEYQQTGRAYNSFISATKKLVIISFPVYFFLYFFVEDIFYYVFGPEWRVAGTYAKIMIPFFMIKFVVSPLTVINQVNKKNKLGMFWQFGLLFLYVCVIFWSQTQGYKVEVFLHVLSVVLSLYYLFFYFLIYSHAKRKS